MKLLEQPNLCDLLARLTEGMLDYMQAGHASYSEKDVEKCREILISHVEQLDTLNDRGQAQELVKATILTLNKLNQSAGEDLIETDQREDICAFIIKAGAIKGFNSENEDVTEEWREW
jgi:hypothetical protein